MATRSPAVDLEGFDRIRLAYDAEDDLLFIHLDGPREALTEQVDNGWYIRVADGTIVGMELHGFKRMFLTKPFHAEVSRPALDELEAFTGRSFETESIRAEGSTSELPRFTRLVILMLGQAVSKYEALLREEYEQDPVAS